MEAPWHHVSLWGGCASGDVYGTTVKLREKPPTFSKDAYFGSSPKNDPQVSV